MINTNLAQQKKFVYATKYSSRLEQQILWDVWWQAKYIFYEIAEVNSTMTYLIWKKQG